MQFFLFFGYFVDISGLKREQNVLTTRQTKVDVVGEGGGGEGLDFATY